MKMKRAGEQVPSPSTLLVSKNILNGQPLPPGAIPADRKELQHINTYGALPEFYLDYEFECRDCGSREVWTAEQQKWWYEVAKGHIDSLAVRCRQCRQKRKMSGKGKSGPKTGPNRAL